MYTRVRPHFNFYPFHSSSASSVLSTIIVEQLKCVRGFINTSYRITPTVRTYTTLLIYSERTIIIIINSYLKTDSSKNTTIDNHLGHNLPEKMLW